LIGPPGSGKTMAAERIAGILPPLTLEESMEITKIYSIMGLLDEKEPLIQSRPFRSVHHTATRAALAGGGMIPTPGEITLAHGGVLFLDELPEFSKSVIEVLRQPLEEHQMRIARTHGNYVFPADFILIAAMNPCPCGCYPDMQKCTCTPVQIQNYLGRISQPFLDRIDLCVEAPRVEYDSLVEKKAQESSEAIRQRVCEVRNLQRMRYGGTKVNARLDSRETEEFCRLGEPENEVMKQAFAAFGFTARTYHKVLKVARTIADLDGSQEILKQHLCEAIGYRTPDKKYWKR
jgi:magnesium chelatase family protein